MHDPAVTDSRSGIARAAARIDSREGQRPRLTQISTAASPQFQKAADIPDDLAAQLGAGFQNLGRAVLEALAAEAYSKEVLSLELDSLWEAQAMLSRRCCMARPIGRGNLSRCRRSFEFRHTKG
jgi:hypothetical protein